MKLVYMVRREGENGELGKIRDVIQLFEGSPLIKELKEKHYHEGTAAQYEEFTKTVAGDFDGDGDRDEDDREIMEAITG